MAVAPTAINHEPLPSVLLTDGKETDSLARCFQLITQHGGLMHSLNYTMVLARTTAQTGVQKWRQHAGVVESPIDILAWQQAFGKRLLDGFQS